MDFATGIQKKEHAFVNLVDGLRWQPDAIHNKNGFAEQIW